MTADAVEVVGASGVDLLAPGPGENGVVAAAVVAAAPTLDQSLALEPIDEAGDPAAAEQQAIGELAHSQSHAVGVDEVDQDFVGGERQPVDALELVVEARDQLAVRFEQPAPGSQFALGEPALRRTFHIPEGTRVLARATSFW